MGLLVVGQRRRKIIELIIVVGNALVGLRCRKAAVSVDLFAQGGTLEQVVQRAGTLSAAIEHHAHILVGISQPRLVVAMGGLSGRQCLGEVFQSMGIILLDIIDHSDVL